MGPTVPFTIARRVALGLAAGLLGACALLLAGAGRAPPRRRRSR
jgi:hypothetical protein